MILLKDLRRIYQVGDQEVRALDGVSLQIAQGEYISIMGPSGSGKSTLLNVLGLLDRPDSGLYELEGKSVTAMDDEQQARLRSERIGFVFQFFHLVQRLTAAENVELPLMLAGVSPRERHDRVQAVLKAIGLQDRAHHRPDQLSGGQRQRVAIARAAVTRPALLLADEPTGNLDQAAGADVMQLLERLNADGITLLIVTHDRALGARARRRIRMVDGRIVDDAVGPVSA